MPVKRRRLPPPCYGGRMDVARSYYFDRFGDADRAAELRRLQRQATVLLDDELAELGRLGFGPGQRVLEVGCGPGFLTGPLSDVAGDAGGVGIDTSAELLAAASAVVGPAHPNVRFQEGNAYATGLPDAAFDFLYSRLVYQHLSRPLEALKEAARVVRPGGRICLMDIDDGFLALHPCPPAFTRLTERALAAQAQNGGDRLIARKLPSLMREAGLSNVHLRGITVSSLDLGLGPFLDITTRFKAIQVGDAEAMRLSDELGALSRLPVDQQPFGVVVAFFVVGQRPV